MPFLVKLRFKIATAVKQQSLTNMTPVYVEPKRLCMDCLHLDLSNKEVAFRSRSSIPTVAMQTCAVFFSSGTAAESHLN